MGKGSTQRPGDHKAYSDNYDRIFNKDKVNADTGLIELPEWTDALYPKEEDINQCEQ